MSSLLKTTFLVRFASPGAACGVLSLYPWFPMVRETISDTQRMHFGAGFISLGPQQELIMP